MIRVPPRQPFCAHCCEERPDLLLGSFDGKPRWLCAPCRTEPARVLALMAPEPFWAPGGTRVRRARGAP